MEIKPTYVTFEQAKLLKEKGFNIKSKYHYPDLSDKQEICLLTDWNKFTDMSGDSNYYTAPEQHQVIEWLRIKHLYNVYLRVKYVYKEGEFPCDKFKPIECFSVGIENNFKGYHKIIFDYDDKTQTINDWMTEAAKSSEEAYSAALDYVLTKLI